MTAKRNVIWTGAALTAAGLLYAAEKEDLRSRLPVPTADRVRGTYHYFAKVYDLAARLMLFGQENPVRRRVVALAALKPGDVVLDLACGTGANFPFVLDRIGEDGTLIGLDYTPEMLDHARERIAREGWRNVTILQGDAAQLTLEQIARANPAAAQGVDAVISTFAVSVIPNWETALSRAAQVLKPGGRLVIGDAKLSEHWLLRPFDLLADLLGGLAAADISRRPRLLLPQFLEDVHQEERFFGFFYTASGRRNR